VKQATIQLHPASASPTPSTMRVGTTREPPGLGSTQPEDDPGDHG